jgi:hypothetical protein
MQGFYFFPYNLNVNGVKEKLKANNFLIFY